MLSEMGHLQEAVQQLEKHAADPTKLPPASEQVFLSKKKNENKNESTSNLRSFITVLHLLWNSLESRVARYGKFK